MGFEGNGGVKAKKQDLIRMENVFSTQTTYMYALQRFNFLFFSTIYAKAQKTIQYIACIHTKISVK